MTNEEFEIKVREWEHKIEDVILEISRIDSKSKLLLSVFDHKPLCGEFNNLIENRRKALKIANDNPGKMMTGTLRAYNV